MGRATEWPNPSLLRGTDGGAGPQATPHSRSHRVDRKGGWNLRRCWRRWLTTLIPPEDRGHGWEGVWNRGTRSERGGQGPGPQSQLEFEPGWSCLTRSSQGASPLPRHSPQGAQDTGALASHNHTSYGATSPWGTGKIGVPPNIFRLVVGSREEDTVRETEAEGQFGPSWWVAHAASALLARRRACDGGRPGWLRWQRPWGAPADPWETQPERTQTRHPTG